MRKKSKQYEKHIEQVLLNMRSKLSGHLTSQRVHQGVSARPLSSEICSNREFDSELRNLGYTFEKNFLNQNAQLSQLKESL